MSREELNEVVLTVNGAPLAVTVPPRKSLADAIRDDCGLTGTHLGCEQGVCGTCTVLLDDEPVRSCLLFAVQCDGQEIRTVEGLADGEALHPLQEAFSEHHALQCGFCTPGFLMLAVHLYESTAQVDESDVRDLLASNLCRCTGYATIVEATVAALQGAPAGGDR